MSSKGQSLLTDHFNVKKRTSIARNLKNAKTKCQRVSKNTTPKNLTLPNEKTINKSSKRKAELPKDKPVTKKRKLLPRKLDFKNEIGFLFAVSSQTDSLIEIDNSSADSKAEVKLPGYQKIYGFTQDSVLTLPLKFNILSAMFVSMDRAVSMLFNRKEMCTFFKIQKAVQQMTRRNFDLQRLAQIAKVYPEAYSFNQEKSTGFMYESGENRSYFLVLSPVIPENENKLTSTLLIERKNQFQARLLDIVKHHHEAFIRSLNPLVTIDMEQIVRWHPDFKVDDIPDVEQAELPQPPNIPKHTTAKDVLEKARGLFGKKIDAALENAAKKFSEASEVTPTPKPVMDPKFKGIPPALLDKVRAKHAIKMQALLTMPPEECRQRSMLAKLPKIATIIKQYFTSERKSTLELEKVLEKIKFSLWNNLSLVQIDEHIKKLAELAPDWISLVVSKKAYVKINRDIDLNVVIAELEAKL